MTNCNPYDLGRLMAIVTKNPGILRDKLIVLFGDQLNHKSRSKMHRAQKKLKGKLFIQKRGGKCYFFTAEYAKENNIPLRIQVDNRVFRPKTKTWISPADAEDFDFVHRMQEIDRLMPVQRDYHLL